MRTDIDDYLNEKADQITNLLASIDVETDRVGSSPFSEVLKNARTRVARRKKTVINKITALVHDLEKYDRLLRCHVGSDGHSDHRDVLLSAIKDQKEQVSNLEEQIEEMQQIYEEKMIKIEEQRLAMIKQQMLEIQAQGTD